MTPDCSKKGLTCDSGIAGRTLYVGTVLNSIKEIKVLQHFIEGIVW